MNSHMYMLGSAMSLLKWNWLSYDGCLLSKRTMKMSKKTRKLMVKYWLWVWLSEEELHQYCGAVKKIVLVSFFVFQDFVG